MLISLSDFARSKGRDPATARQQAGRGCFKTAVKIGRDWLIDDQEEWEDHRIRSGNYKDFRKKLRKDSNLSIDDNPPNG